MPIIQTKVLNFARNLITLLCLQPDQANLFSIQLQGIVQEVH
jgi:hypothetical protein